ncbi:MAG: STAS-like domain-containing protein [Pseudomonadota bacterium]|nr:STAS-like domain-containing protein [Pseudomonadota bacterium]
MKISISSDFSPVPAGRVRSDGPYSGERFREEHLVPALNSEELVCVNLDGTEGLGSSFLEEAFGGLVRSNNLDYATLKDRLKIETKSHLLEFEVWSYIKDADRAVGAA